MDSNSDGDHDAGETVIARYEYDGRNRRTKKHLNADTDDDFDSFPHFFYNAAWQILETRKTTSENDPPDGAKPEVQYVWSLRYIDALVLRDENKDSDDDCIDGQDERLYFANDANMNVTALMESDGDVVERYVYDPYGNCTVYDDDWSDTVSWANSKKNNIRFCGYFFDNETGLCNPRTRYYHPNLGRWTSRDPGPVEVVVAQRVKSAVQMPSGKRVQKDLQEQYKDGMSLYQYVRSNPGILIDSSGLMIGGVHFSDCECCEEIQEAVWHVNAALDTRECREWFEEHGHDYSTGLRPSREIVCYSNWQLQCLVGYPAFTFPYCVIGVCNSKCAELGEMGLASVIIHELAHHYCPWIPGAEGCPMSAQDACGDALLGQ